MNYWTTPEDISQAWAGLREELERAAAGHGGEEMTFAITVGNGLVADVLQPCYCQVEPRSLARMEPQPWWSVIRRLIRAAAELDGGRALVETRVTLDANERPVRWTQPEAKRLEPRRF